MDIREIARSIADELREKPDHWTKGAYARDADGVPVPLGSARSSCWCVRGHLAKRGLDRYGSPEETAIEKLTGIQCLVEFNDEPERTVGDIIALCEKVAAQP